MVLSKTGKLLRDTKRNSRCAPVTNDIAGNLILPNHSGVKNHKEIKNNFVPYIGATADVILGAYSLGFTATEYISQDAANELSFHFADADTGMKFYSGANEILNIVRDGSITTSWVKFNTPLVYSFQVGGNNKFVLTNTIAEFSIPLNIQGDLTTTGKAGIGTATPDTGFLQVGPDLATGIHATDDLTEPTNFHIIIPAARATNKGRGIGFMDSGTINGAILGMDEGSGGAQGLGFYTGTANNIAERIRIDKSGNVNATKIKLTVLGGYAIKLTNKTGAASVRGEVVRTDAGNDSAVTLAVTAETNPIGVFLETGVADGDKAWVVVSGIAHVLADTAGFTRGDRLVTSLAAATVARATTNNAPAVAVHFQEIGHALETAAANTVGRVVLHFN